MDKSSFVATCSECGVVNCYRRDKKFPPFCLTEAADARQLAAARDRYTGAGDEARWSRAAADVEGTYYGRLTRAEEIIAFANRIGAKKIGIATCIGLLPETRIFVKVLRAKGLESVTVLCKVGSIDKCEVGIPDAKKIKPGAHESLCNPIYQAEYLNGQGTQLNVANGLCVGHDSLFFKNSQAPVTTLITKDRVTGHNPAAALYASHFYYQRLFNNDTL
ncbi:MAG: DUF1847 domain-containing protein [Verrucomicrobiales bacterium]|jgi:uncharacterized metal-binding protein|nr:DUF1847 domain-containing protein [Verrucomicrobiales bacterium]